MSSALLMESQKCYFTISFDKKGRLNAGIILLTTSASTFLDRPINKFLINRKDPVLNAVNDVGYIMVSPTLHLWSQGAFISQGL